MKTLAYIICVFKSLPKIVELEMENFAEHLKKFSEREKRYKEQKEIIQDVIDRLLYLPNKDLEQYKKQLNLTKNIETNEPGKPRHLRLHCRQPPCPP